MAALTDEMKQMVQEKQCFLATVDTKGEANLVTKGSMMVLDDHTLVYGEVAGGTTYHNLQENSRAVVAVADEKTFKGYRFASKATMETSGPLYDKVARGLAKAGFPRTFAAVRIDVEEIYDLSAKNPGAKIS